MVKAAINLDGIPPGFRFQSICYLGACNLRFMYTRISVGQLLLLVCLALMFCTTREKSTLCRMTTLITTEGSVTTTTTYSYENSKLKLASTTSGTTTYETAYQYDANGNLSKSIFTEGGVSRATSYSYNGLNQLVSSLYTFNGDTTIITYTYNDSQQLATKTSSVQIGGGPVAVSTETYEYVNVLTRNASSMTFTSGTTTYVVTYQYDNKLNPERDLILPSLQHFNNIVKITQGGVVETISYEYNNNGYPVSSISSSGKTQSWTYHCEEI